MEKKLIPGEAFITGKRAYVFDGGKVFFLLNEILCGSY